MDYDTPDAVPPPMDYDTLLDGCCQVGVQIVRCGGAVVTEFPPGSQRF
jgi:hypothetical protein